MKIHFCRKQNAISYILISVAFKLRVHLTLNSKWIYKSNILVYWLPHYTSAKFSDRCTLIHILALIELSCCSSFIQTQVRSMDRMTISAHKAKEPGLDGDATKKQYLENSVECIFRSKSIFRSLQARHSSESPQIVTPHLK